MAATHRSKQEYREQTTQRMERHLPTPQWNARQKLALASHPECLE
jgi:hypothetical protein